MSRELAECELGWVQHAFELSFWLVARSIVLTIKALGDVGSAILCALFPPAKEPIVDGSDHEASNDEGQVAARTEDRS